MDAIEWSTNFLKIPCGSQDGSIHSSFSHFNLQCVDVLDSRAFILSLVDLILILGQLSFLAHANLVIYTVRTGILFENNLS